MDCDGSSSTIFVALFKAINEVKEAGDEVDVGKQGKHIRGPSNYKEGSSM